MKNYFSKGYTTLEVICSLILFTFVAASIAIILPMAYQNMSGWRDRFNLSRCLESQLEIIRSKSYDDLEESDSGWIKDTDYEYRVKTNIVKEAVDSEGRPTWIEALSGSDDIDLAKMTIVEVASLSGPRKILSGRLLTFNTNTRIPADYIYVASIDIEKEPVGNSGKWKVTVTVTVRNGLGNPVNGVTVTGEWSGLVSQTTQKVTSGNGKKYSGQVTFSSTQTPKYASGYVTFTVVNLVKLRYNDLYYHYDPKYNVETSDTIAIP